MPCLEGALTAQGIGDADATILMTAGSEASLASAEQQWNDAMKALEDKLQASLWHLLLGQCWVLSCMMHDARRKDARRCLYMRVEYFASGC